MKSVTVSEFRLDTGKVYNEVQSTGKVELVHRDREPMAIVTEKYIDDLTGKAYKKGLASK